MNRAKASFRAKGWLSVCFLAVIVGLWGALVWAGNVSPSIQDSSGKVGINTSTPQDPLTVAVPTTAAEFGDGDDAIGLRTTSVATSNTNHMHAPWMTFRASIWTGSSAADKGMSFQNTGVSGQNGAYGLKFSSSDLANIMVIRGDSGQLGFGTVNPTDQVSIARTTSTTEFNVNQNALGLRTTSVASSNNDHRHSPWMTMRSSIWNGTTAVDKGVSFQTVGVLGTNSAYALKVSSSDVGSILVIRGDSGRVGVGTATPSSSLHVVGDAFVEGNIGAKYQDIAEWVPSRAFLAPGTVVVVGNSGRPDVVASSEAYDTKVAGVVSDRPGVVLGDPGANRDQVKVAHSGRVKVKVDAGFGPISAGDLLVTSPTPGFAMRSRPIEIAGTEMHRPGTLLGKALEPLAEGQGEILVLLTLQ